MKLPCRLLLLASLLVFSARLVAADTADEIIARINAAMQKRIGTEIQYPAGTLTDAALTPLALKLGFKNKEGEVGTISWSKIDWPAADWVGDLAETHRVVVGFPEDKAPFRSKFGSDGPSKYMSFYALDGDLGQLKSDLTSLIELAKTGPLSSARAEAEEPAPAKKAKPAVDGPTEEQTIEFIQENWPKSINYGGSKRGVGLGGKVFLAAGMYDNWRIGYVDGALKFSYRDQLIGGHDGEDDIRGKNTRYEVTFNIADIQELEIGWNGSLEYRNYDDEMDRGTRPYFILFSAKRGKEITISKDGSEETASKVYIPFGNAEKDRNPKQFAEELKQNQLFKAVNHLRRLRGAPEPVKF